MEVGIRCPSKQQSQVKAIVIGYPGSPTQNVSTCPNSGGHCYWDGYHPRNMHGVCLEYEAIVITDGQSQMHPKVGGSSRNMLGNFNA